VQEHIEALKDTIKNQSLPFEHRKQAQKEFNGIMQEQRMQEQRRKEATSPPTDDYRGQHGAPGRGAGAPIHDLTQVYPQDIYTHPHYYEDLDDPVTRTSMDIARSMRGRSKGMITVFRAVPKDVPKGTRINPGDWVGIHKGYAQEHGRSHLGGQFRILQKTVPIRHVYTAGDSINEWGYDPSEETK